MSIYSWQVFAAVAEQRSFVKAAEVLNVSQSAVSHIIKKIEDEQGFHLFIRNRNNVELTVNGQLLMPYVKNLLECNRALDQHLQDFESAAKGEVRIAAFNSATRLWLPRIINSFHEKYPDIRVRVRQTGDKQMRALIDAGEVDLAFLSTAYPAKGSFLPLHSTAIICLAPKDYVPANGVSVTPDDLEGQHLILQLEGYDTEMIMWVHDNNVNVRTDCKIEVDSTCHDYVVHGFGFCLSSEMTFECDPADVSVWPLDPPYMRTIGLVTVYPDYISPSVDLFRKEIINFMNNNNLLNI